MAIFLKTWLLPTRKNRGCSIGRPSLLRVEADSETTDRLSLNASQISREMPGHPGDSVWMCRE